MRKPDFDYLKTKAQMSFAVTNSTTHLLPKSENLLLKTYRPVCVRLSRKPQRLVFSHRCSDNVMRTCMLGLYVCLLGYVKTK